MIAQARRYISAATPSTPPHPPLHPEANGDGPSSTALSMHMRPTPSPGTPVPHNPALHVAPPSSVFLCTAVHSDSLPELLLVCLMHVDKIVCWPMIVLLLLPVMRITNVPALRPPTHNTNSTMFSRVAPPGQNTQKYFCRRRCEEANREWWPLAC